MRIDVMTRMRGVAPFSTLWRRRTSVDLADGARCEVMALPSRATVPCSGTRDQGGKPSSPGH